MTNVKLNDTYRVEIDDYNHTLYEKRMVKSKKDGSEHEGEVVVGYFGNMTNVLKRVIDKEVIKSNSDCKNFEEYLQKLSEIVNQVDAIASDLVYDL